MSGIIEKTANTLFNNLEIIKYLDSKNSVFCNSIVELYNVCDNILKLIPKEFSNYTLHDIGHSIRVIGHMTCFIENEFDDFSELELAIMVYCGLLHDIGMFMADEEKVILLKKYNNDFNSVQEFIRKEHGKRVVNILEYEYSDDVRIRNIFKIPFSSYNIHKIVAEICRSHSEDFEWVISNLTKDEIRQNFKFNPQFIAILLRLGDALDIDDNRTPTILYNMLRPKGNSDKEWKKHVAIHNYNKVELTKVKRQLNILFKGECSCPKIHRKLQEYFDYLNSELIKICWIVKDYDQKYYFKINNPINDEIKTIGFSTSELRFNLDYNKITKLLMGENIYGGKKYGLREIIQNSIDAIMLKKEIILNNPNKTINIQYVPTIKIILDEENNEVSIVDNGIGMSMEVIKSYFLSIGNSYYISDSYKENRYSYKPIGKFGIGFLSCFMLSNEVKLETRYLNKERKTIINLEKDCPYITLFEENCIDNNIFFEGTKITLNYKDFTEVFENEIMIINFLKKFIITDEINILVEREKISTNILNSFNSKMFNIKTNNKNLLHFSFEVENDLGFIANVYDFIDNSIFYFHDNMDDFKISYIFRDIYHEYEFPLYFEMDLDYMKIDTILEAKNILAKLYDRMKDIYEDDNNIAEIRKLTSEYCEIYNYINTRYGDVKLIDEMIIDLFDKELLKASYSNGKLIWYNIHLEPEPEEYDDDDYYDSSKYTNGKKVLSIISKHNYEKIPFNEIALHSQYLNGSKLYKNEINVIAVDSRKMFFPFDTSNNVQKFNCEIYLKNILIENICTISFPVINTGTKIKKIRVNIFSDEYNVNVARNNFSEESIQKLSYEIGKAFYTWLYENRTYFNTTQKELLWLFINTYYNN